MRLIQPVSYVIRLCVVFTYVLGLSNPCVRGVGAILCLFLGSPLDLQIKSIWFATWPHSPTYKQAEP